MNWQPDPVGLQNLMNLLKESTQVGVAKQIHQQLQQFNQIPDFNLYLLYILSQPHYEEYSRTVAGLLLKNNLLHNFGHLQPQFKQVFKAHILSLLGDPSPSVRRTVGTILTTFFSKEESVCLHWPELIPSFVSCMDSGDFKKADGAFSALLKICEDSPRKLEEEKDMQGQCPLNFLIPKFLSFFTSTHGIFRQYAISCVNQFVVEMPHALLSNLDNYLQGLFHLANDTNSEVRKRISQAFVMLLEMKPDFLAPHIKQIIKYMLHTTQDEDESVALEACEFWSVIAEQKSFQPILTEFLPELIPVLINGMIYTEMDLVLLDGEEDDSMVPDHAKDLKPRFYSSKRGAVEKSDAHGEKQTESQGGNENEDEEDENEEDEDDEDEDEYGEVGDWNLRKCSAASLDIISGVYRSSLLPILLPHLQQRINKEDEWPVVESSILALGAVAEGCIDGMTPHLTGLIPFLTTKLKDKKPLVRSITCWTLSRYGRWIVQVNPGNIFQKILEEFLSCLLDNNKKVQEAACSAFATLEEEARGNLVPYLPGILSHLAQAFEKYQAKNLLILYDAVGTLADSVGSALNSPPFIDVLMPPLIKKWNELSDTDRNLFPLLECLTSVVVALGVGFTPFAPPVYQRCIRLIEGTLMAQSYANAESTDKEFMVCALDLISGLVEGLGVSVESLVANSNLIGLLFECSKDPAPDVRQSAFALVGDLAKTCFPHLKPILQSLMQVILNNLYPEFVSVCNNASWAMGEIAMKVGPEIKPLVPVLLSKMVPLVKRNLNRGLLENIAIAVGRLGFVCPEEVAPHMEDFLQPWCLILRALRDDTEKASAFHGLCSMIKHNPQGVTRHFVYVCDAIASWGQPESTLASNFHQILHTFKNSVDAKSWVDYFNTFPQELRTILQTKYGL